MSTKLCPDGLALRFSAVLYGEACRRQVGREWVLKARSTGAQRHIVHPARRSVWKSSLALFARAWLPRPLTVRLTTTVFIAHEPPRCYLRAAHASAESLRQHTEALPCACAARPPQLRHSAVSSNSIMPSIASFCRICLVGTLALSAWTEGKELTSTTVTDGASLGAALKRDNVEVINVKGEQPLWFGALRFEASHLCELLS